LVGPIPKLFAFVDGTLQHHADIHFLCVVEEIPHFFCVIAVLDHASIGIVAGAPRDGTLLQQHFDQFHISSAKSVEEGCVAFAAFEVGVDAQFQDDLGDLCLAVDGCVADGGPSVKVHFEGEVRVVFKEHFDGSNVSLFDAFEESVRSLESVGIFVDSECFVDVASVNSVNVVQSCPLDECFP
jgi:hypothetical protein